MFIPFAGQWINPAHVTRMDYVEGKRLTICLADGLPSLTVKGEAADVLFKRMTTEWAYWVAPDNADDGVGMIAGLNVPGMPVRKVEQHDHNVEVVLNDKTPIPSKKGRRK